MPGRNLEEKLEETGEKPGGSILENLKRKRTRTGIEYSGQDNDYKIPKDH
jgi:hypothetical protein